MVTKIPLDRHPAYKRLKEKLKEAATGRFFSFLGQNKVNLHKTGQLYAKNDSENRHSGDGKPTKLKGVNNVNHGTTDSK